MEQIVEMTKTIEITLEERLEETICANDYLAQSPSQLITDYSLKPQDYSLKPQDYSLKPQVLQEQQNSTKKEEDVEKQKKEMEEVVANLKCKEAEILELKVAASRVADLEKNIAISKEELARSEIKYSDLEQSTQNDLSKALEVQKEKYNKVYREKMKENTNEWQNKMKEFCAIANNKVTEYEQRLKVKNEELEKLESVVERIEEMEKVNEKEKAFLQKSYDKLKENAKIILEKYEKEKERTKTLQTQGDSYQACKEEIQSLEREMIKVKAENRNLSNQLNLADIKLRELNKESFETVRNVKNTTRQSVIGTTRTSREALTGGISRMASRESLPGRVPRQSTSTLDSADAPDDEIGEMFSSSYLSDLKDGHCELVCKQENQSLLREIIKVEDENRKLESVERLKKIGGFNLFGR